MGYPFGKDISYTFYPTDDEGNLISGIPAQTATLYVFTTKPSPDAGQNGTGAFASTTASWSASATSCTFTISAINDPDPDAIESEYTYWVAVNFILKTAGQSQCVIRAVQMERVDGNATQVSVSSSDLAALWSPVATYASSNEIAAFVTAATDILKARLRSRGFEWAQINRMDRLNNIVKFMVLAMVCRSETQESGDSFEKLAEEFDKTAATLREAVKFEYDETESGEPTTTNTNHRFGIIIR